MIIGIQELTQEEQKLISYYRNAEPQYKDMVFNIVRMSSNLVDQQCKLQQDCKVLAFPRSR